MQNRHTYLAILHQTLKPTLNELKLTLASTARNSLRDKLRNMSKDELLAERAKSLKAYNAKDTRVNWYYYSYIDDLCEAKGFVAPSPCIWVL